MVHNHQSNLAKTTGCITKLFATILQLNLSPPVCLRQESEGKACHFLSGDVDEEHLFGFRDQKVAGSNPVTSTKNQPVKAGFFVLSAQKQWIIPDFSDFPA